jgi:hypothetical protein
MSSVKKEMVVTFKCQWCGGKSREPLLPDEPCGECLEAVSEESVLLLGSDEFGRRMMVSLPDRVVSGLADVPTAKRLLMTRFGVLTPTLSKAIQGYLV